MKLMPEFEINTADRVRAQNLVEFVKKEIGDMPVEARFVFAIEIARFLRPEFDELKRRSDQKKP